MTGKNTSSPLLYWAEPEKPFTTGSWLCLSKTRWWRPVRGGDHSFTPAYQVLSWGPGKAAIRHDVPFSEELIIRWEGETHILGKPGNNQKVALDPEKAMATHSSTLAWKIPWTEEPGRLQFMGLQRVRHNWAISLSLFTFLNWRRKWQPTPVFLPGESQERQSLVGCCLWGCTELDMTEAT